MIKPLTLKKRVLYLLILISELLSLLDHFLDLRVSMRRTLVNLGVERVGGARLRFGPRLRFAS